jgi:hypothetical protein
LFSVLEVFSEGRSKNQFLFMFTGCVKCCTFLFIDVIVVWFVLLFVLCFHYCFQMFKCIKKGYYVLEFFIGVGNRDIMTKELSCDVFSEYFIYLEWFILCQSHIVF